MDNMRAGLGLQHIGIIKDGNGRWAKKRGLPRKYGHREGAKAFRRIVEYCDKLGLRYLTVYAFSTENWKRPEDEVNSIMQLLEQYIDGMTVNVAFNYGGRDELVRAARQLAIQAQQGKLDPQQINEQMLSDHLYTSGQPDPDLIIRPSGEERLSNFLIWQAAYSEFVFMDVLWPDFTPAHLDQALEIFSHRNRRYGQV